MLGQMTILGITSPPGIRGMSVHTFARGFTSESVSLVLEDFSLQPSASCFLSESSLRDYH